MSTRTTTKQEPKAPASAIGDRRPLALTVTQAAAELQISETACYRLIQGNIIPHFRLPSSSAGGAGDIRVSADLLARWVAQQCSDWAELAQWDPEHTWSLVLGEQQQLADKARAAAQPKRGMK